jgi:hypothetical protein
MRRTINALGADTTMIATVDSSMATHHSPTRLVPRSAEEPDSCGLP